MTGCKGPAKGTSQVKFDDRSRSAWHAMPGNPFPSRTWAVCLSQSMAPPVSRSTFPSGWQEDGKLVARIDKHAPNWPTPRTWPRTAPLSAARACRSPKRAQTHRHQRRTQLRTSSNSRDRCPSVGLARRHSVRVKPPCTKAEPWRAGGVKDLVLAMPSPSGYRTILYVQRARWVFPPRRHQQQRLVGR